MSNDRLQWILKYHFDSEYASEGLWHQAFEKFKKDLKEYDSKHLSIVNQ